MPLADSTASDTATSPSWPLWLWSLQLLPAGLFVAFAVWRLVMGQSIKSDPVRSVVLLVTGLLWVSTVLGLLLFKRTRRWLIDRRLQWCLSFFSLAFAVLLCDIGLSVTGIVPTMGTMRAKSLVHSHGSFTKHRLIPQEVVKGGDTVVVNSRGFRGPEISVDKDPSSVRVVFLGGSQVFDYHSGGWPSMVGPELAQRGLSVEIINAGIPGHDTTDSLGKLLTDVWTLQPDIIFLCHTWNDTKYFSRVDAESPYRRLPPPRAEDWHNDWRIHPRGIDKLLSYSAIYRHFRFGFAQFLYNREGSRRGKEDHRQRVVREWGLRQFRLNLELIAELSDSIGSQLVLCRQAHLATEDGTGAVQEEARRYGLRNSMPHDELMRAFRECNEIIDAIGDERGVPIVDMDGEMTGRAEYFRDGVHFSREGSREAARIVARELEPLVRQRLEVTEAAE